MTENMNTEPGRPAWAAGLDLSAGRWRPDDQYLMTHDDLHLGLRRRLADAEMRVAELERLLGEAQAEYIAPQRGEPDFLIDRHGDCWFQMKSGGYAMQGEGEMRRPEYVHIAWGPVTEAWR
jgi:hypothetical protein